MAQSQRLVLAHIGELFRGWQTVTQTVQQVLLALFLQSVFQLQVAVKIILDRGFAFTGDKDKFLNAGGFRLLHRIVNQGLINNGEHFFRHSLGRR